ncbi:crossover junction endodeoxyribonuclease RuvC [Jannaschia sp. Os4]|uniref:crossover junction endodeoxyribonuclease RuvC n=1 Tax=Jannaschia sp. Os4 TaxID=2807617 RepID=UPI001939712A|nr:crossover junction endodeoxyribonuclease RuvC [Jannaschia sp. Os4]MBM2574724.1 crossover junction endodeoxyribonuclease RuvC [Jannaschia sp. Os4]
MRVMGIDPGLRACGWGVIDVDGGRQRFVACGTVRPGGTALSDRLLDLHRGLAALVEAHRPDAGAIEQTFVNRDGQGTLKLGQARGVALLALAQAGLAVGEYANNAVKKAVVGVGRADKRQIGHMIRLQLPGADPDSDDAADALAIALTHAFHLAAGSKLADALGAGR